VIGIMVIAGTKFDASVSLGIGVDF
jgi:hypothetical protein